MPKLYEIASCVRSKNAGPFHLTFDVIFDTREKYEHVRDSGVLNPSVFANLYGADINKVEVHNYDAGKAIKVTIPRPTFSGDANDLDITGGQQYALIVELNVPAVA